MPGVKLSLLSDGMTIYMESPKESTHDKILERLFNKIAGYIIS